MMRRALFATLILAAGCRYDPVPAAEIKDLGDEKGTPSATHRPGQPCLVCHDKYGGAQPEMVVGGTVYAISGKTTKKLVPAKDIRVTMLDSNGDTRKACTNSAGNFWVPKAYWEGVVFPLAPVAGGIVMHSLVNRDGSCSSCHRLPDEESIDALTGAGHDSAGAIIVDPESADPLCKEGK
jgi:hypothetical protein